MRISDDVIEKVLQQGGVIDESQLAQLKLLAEHSHTSLYNIVISERVVTPQDLAKLVSKQIGVPFVEIEPKDIPKEVLMKIPEHIARQYNVVLFAQDSDGTLSLAMEDPDDIQALNFIQKEIGYNLNVFLATHENILDCLENYVIKLLRWYFVNLCGWKSCIYLGVSANAPKPHYENQISNTNFTDNNLK